MKVVLGPGWPAILIHEAIGSNLTCIYVDHGLMRLNETEEIIQMYRNNYNLNLVF